MIDGAVLAGGVPALQADQQRPLVLGIHQALLLPQLAGVGGDRRQGVLRRLVMIGEAGIDLGDCRARRGSACDSSLRPPLTVAFRLGTCRAGRPLVSDCLRSAGARASGCGLPLDGSP